jgi:hypothetical protein
VAMALPGDQPGDRGGGFRHLESGAEGAGEGRQLWRQQAPNVLLEGADGGLIQWGIRGLGLRSLGGWPLGRLTGSVVPDQTWMR